MSYTSGMGSTPWGPILSTLFILSSARLTNGQGCSSTYALGLGTRQIPDDQITCSGISACEDVRPNSATPWYAINSVGADYVRFDLGEVKTVTHLEVFRAGLGRYITAFRLFHSVDGVTWDAYEPVDNHLFHAGVQTIDLKNRVSVMFALNNPNMVDSWIQTRHIAINPTNWTDSSPFMKLEVHGCELTSPYTPTSTAVSGSIQSDTTWTTSNSPYVVRTKLAIPVGVTLSVEQGVRIVMAGQQSVIEVEGSMIARGQSNNRVFISGGKMLFTPEYVKWSGIKVLEGGRLVLHKADVIQGLVCVTGSAENIQISEAFFSNCSTGVNFNSGGKNDSFVSLSGTTITNGISGLAIFAEPTRQIVLIEHFTITEQTRFGIRAATDHLILKANNATITRTERYGIHISSSENSRIYLSNSQIIENSGTGVLIDSNRKSGEIYLNVTNSQFRRNSYGIFVSVFQQSKNGDWLISGNTFEGNIRAGIRLDLYGRSTHSETLTIQDNDFIANGITTDICALCFNAFYQVSGIYLIDNNRLERNGQALNVKVTTDLPTLNVTVTNNVISHTTGSYAVDLELGNIEFVNNNITASANKALRFSRLFPDKFYNNSFDNPLSPLEIELETPFDADTAINLARNFWGSADPNFVTSRVLSFYQNVEIALVNVFPFYANADFTQLYEGGVDLEFSQSDPASVGGKLNSNVTIHSGSRLIITKSIWVPSGVVLMIRPNAHLTFMKGRGIFAKGIIIAEGDTTGLIKMNGYNEDTWSGIQLKETALSLKSVQLMDASVYIRLKADHTNVEITLEDVEVIGGFRVLDASFDSASSFRLKDCNFTDVSSGVYLNVKGGGSCDLTINSSIISKTQGSAVEISPDPRGFGNRTVNIYARESKFIENGYAIVLNDNNKVLRVSADVLMCEFRSSKISAIKISAWLDYFLLQNSQFSASTGPVSLFFRKECTKGAHIKNNEFASSLTTDINIDTETASNRPFSGMMKIVGNSFTRLNSVAENGLIFNTDRFGEVYITDNIFTGGQQFAVQVGLYGYSKKLDISRNYFTKVFSALDFYSEQTTDTTVTVNKNELRRNSGHPLLVIEMRTAPITLMEVSQNTFEANGNLNKNGTIIQLYTPAVTIKRNTFSNPDSRYNVEFVPKGYSTSSIEFIQNNWGTTDLQAIAQQLYDRNDNKSLPVFNLQPATPNSSLVSELKGSIVDTVVLSSDRSPYTVPSNVEIIASGTLIVEEAVVLLFEENVGLNVHGQLVVRGTVENPVQFLAAAPSHKWSGVDFLQTNDRPVSKIHNLIVNNTVEGVEVRTSNIQMENVTSDFSFYDGFTFKYEPEESSLVIDGLKARNNGFSGVYDTRLPGGGALQLTNCELQANVDSGLSVRGSADIKLSRCVVSNSLTGVFVSERQFGVMEITSSLIYNNSQHAIKVEGAEGTNLAEYILTSNVIRDHSTSTQGIALSVLDIEVNQITDNKWLILDNTFDSNNYNQYLVKVFSTKSGPLHVHILRNTFVNNKSPLLSFTTIDNYPTALDFELNTVEGSDAAVSILYLEGVRQSKKTIKMKSNRFFNNRGSDVVWYRIAQGESTMELSNNTFVDNNVLYTVKIQSPMVTLDDNVFSNPWAWCELELPAFDPDWRISARRSYWGFADLFNITDRICSFDKDMSRGRVDYFPFRLSNDSLNLVGRETPEFAVHGAFGGVVTNQTLLNSIQPYTIWRSIFVEEGAMLTVAGGAQLRFAPKRGIYARGQLNIGEDEGQKTRLSALENEWEGIRFQWSESRDRVENVRLRGGLYPWSGRLEYLINGEYGTVCNVGFDEKDAMAACRELGYTKIDRVQFYGASNQTGGPIALYGLQCTGSESSLLDCNKDTGAASECTHAHDIGVACFGSRQFPKRPTDSNIYNSVVDGSKSGIQIHSLSVALADVEISNTKESGLTLDAQYKLLDLGRTVIRNSGKHGIDVLMENSIGISNCVLVENAEHGVNIQPTIGEIHLSNITSRNNKAGMVVKFVRSLYNSPQSIFIEDSIFENHRDDYHALQVSTVSSIGPSTVTITRNRFFNNSFGDLDVLVQSEPETGEDKYPKTLDISNNNFNGGGPNAVTLLDGVSLNILNNTFQDGRADTGCLLVVRPELNPRRVPVVFTKTVEISRNSFDSINGVCIVELKSSNRDSFNGLFVNNQIKNSVSDIASIILASPLYTLTNNSFSNPQSDIEVKVEATRGSTVINNGMIRAWDNNWGTTDLVEIQRRITDANDDTSLYLLQLNVPATTTVSTSTTTSAVPTETSTPKPTTTSAVPTETSTPKPTTTSAVPTETSTPKSTTTSVLPTTTSTPKPTQTSTSRTTRKSTAKSTSSSTVRSTYKSTPSSAPKTSITDNINTTSGSTSFTRPGPVVTLNGTTIGQTSGSQKQTVFPMLISVLLFQCIKIMYV